MEAFNSLIGSLGQAGGGGLGGLLKLGTGLFSAINQFSLAQKEKSAMDQSIYYSKHPEAISAIAAKLQQPLSTGLTQGVGNVVNAQMAEQGLSQAPGIQSQVMSQALAPYQQQNQEMALQAALQAIGLPAEALAAIRGSMNPSGMASIFKNLQLGGGGGSPPASATSEFPWPMDSGGGGDASQPIPDPMTGTPAGGGSSIYG